jgi:adenine deaminase
VKNGQKEVLFQLHHIGVVSESSPTALNSGKEDIPDCMTELGITEQMQNPIGTCSVTSRKIYP